MTKDELIELLQRHPDRLHDAMLAYETAFQNVEDMQYNPEEKPEKEALKKAKQNRLETECFLRLIEDELETYKILATLV